MRFCRARSWNFWWAISALIAIQPILAFAGGGSSAGGGDLCEDRIKIVRDDLKEWIVRGGPSGLVLPPNVTVAQYSEAMSKEIDHAKIQCVGPSDSGYPITIHDTPKVCRFDRHLFGGTQITCDSEKFQAMNESDQYVLIHHEYAGLSGFEVPNDDDSVYGISNQISGYLIEQVVKKLSVKQGPGANGAIPAEKLALYQESLSLALPQMHCSGAKMEDLIRAANSGFITNDGTHRRITLIVQPQDGQSQEVITVTLNPDDLTEIRNIGAVNFTLQTVNTGDQENPVLSKAMVEVGTASWCDGPPPLGEVEYQ